VESSVKTQYFLTYSPIPFLTPGRETPPPLLHSFTPSLLHSFTLSLLPSFPLPLFPIMVNTLDNIKEETLRNKLHGY